MVKWGGGALWGGTDAVWGASGDAQFRFYVDFDRDNDFSDPGEEITAYVMRAT